MPDATKMPSVTIDGQAITIAPLNTVNYKAVESGDAVEITKLAKSAQSLGFFYLDLKSEAEGHFLQDMRTLYKVGKAYFHEPEHVKSRSLFADEEKGWKPDGKGQTLEIPRDEPSILPPTLTPHQSLFPSITTTSHAITKTLLAALSTSCSLPDLPAHHLDTNPSASGLKLDCVPSEDDLSDVPFSEHTDMGTLTLLFCDDYTTEVRLSDGSEEEEGEGKRGERERQRWAFVEPKDGCAIVNVADSLQRLSGGFLKSRLHRVGQPLRGGGDRYCVLYYLRPGTAAAA